MHSASFSYNDFSLGIIYCEKKTLIFKEFKDRLTLCAFLLLAKCMKSNFKNIISFNLTIDPQETLIVEERQNKAGEWSLPCAPLPAHCLICQTPHPVSLSSPHMENRDFWAQEGTTKATGPGGKLSLC